MSNELQGAINVLVSRIEQRSRELTEMKRMVNSLCQEDGQPMMYSDADLVVKGSSTVIDSDRFYGKPPTGAAREYLELRKKAVTLDDIVDALERGGFDFDAQGWPEDQRVRHLGSSMGRNPQIFHRLPNQNTWGLTMWYPNVKVSKRAAKASTKQPDNGSQEPESTDKTKTASAE
jgi:hypothetical protein